VVARWRFLAFHDDHATHGTDIWMMKRDGDLRPLVVTPASELNMKFSPDGRWIAFWALKSGRAEVYVRPFPNVDAGKWTVSTTGGHSPVWSRDGRELFYTSGASLMAVSVDGRGSSFVAGTPARLFDGPFDTTQDDNYDVFPDGMTFVMVEADPAARPTRLQVILNWSEELSQPAPAN
jgi:Tol biopolymer transport system component